MAVGAPAISSVKSRSFARNLKQDHCRAWTVVGVNEGHSHTLDNDGLIKLDNLDPVHGHL